MGGEKNWFEKFSFFMDQNIRGVQYGIYSIAGVGLLIALRSVRPFAKFSLPSDIPAHFLEKKMSFIAKVKTVQPGSAVNMNPVLLVDHQPLIALRKKSITEGLPLEISSISITNNGFIWLQSVLNEENISFIPLRISNDRVYSLIFKKNQNIGQQLVKIGFATVSPIDVALEKDHYYLKYYKRLLAEEKRAERKGVGMWADGKVSLPSGSYSLSASVADLQEKGKNRWSEILLFDVKNQICQLRSKPSNVTDFTGTLPNRLVSSRSHSVALKLPPTFQPLIKVFFFGKAKATQSNIWMAHQTRITHTARNVRLSTQWLRPHTQGHLIIIKPRRETVFSARKSWKFEVSQGIRKSSKND